MTLMRSFRCLFRGGVSETSSHLSASFLAGVLSCVSISIHHSCVPLCRAFYYAH